MAGNRTFEGLSQADWAENEENFSRNYSVPEKVLFPAIRRSHMENNEIKSPIFKAEPGWGGILANGLRHHFYSFIVPIAVIILVLFGIHTLSIKYTEYANTQMGITIGMVSKPTISIVAEAGQGIGHLVKRALNDYLTNNPTIDMNPGRKAYVVNYVSNLYKNVPVISGESVEFRKDDMILAIQKSKELKDYQLEEWAKYYTN